MSLHVKFLPLSKETNEEVALEFAVEDLREEVQVGDEGSLEDDWDVRGVEQLDWVWVGLTSDSLVLELKFDTEALKRRKKRALE